MFQVYSTAGPQRGWKDLLYWKKSVISSEIEPGTFWLVAQCPQMRQSSKTMAIAVRYNGYPSDSKPGVVMAEPRSDFNEL
jgi:hypothetical protein